MDFVQNKKTKDGHHWRCKKCHNKSNTRNRNITRKKPEYKSYLEYMRKYRTFFKQKCIKYKGGKCSICGYSSCTAALDFHHMIATEKDFQIGRYSSSVFTDKIKKELDKCILICANCHRELHYNHKGRKVN